MRALLSTLAIGFGGVAMANPCGTAPKSEIYQAKTWMGVYRIVAGKHATAKDEKTASEYMCAAQPCGPDQAISLVAEMMGIGAALVFKNQGGDYTILTMPVDLPPHAFEAQFKQLAPNAIHVSVDFEELGREMWCEDEDRDKNGDCVDGRTATVGLGFNDHDMLVNPISRTVTWAQACSVSEDTPHRDSTVRRHGKHFGYESCEATDRTEWFAFKGGKCVPSAPFDLKALFKKGRGLASKGDFAAAVTVFDELVLAEPNDAGVRGERGYLKHKAGDNAGAMADLDAALGLKPIDKVRGPLQYNRGLVLLAGSKHAEALAAFQDADRLRPSKAAKAKIKAVKALMKK